MLFVLGGHLKTGQRSGAKTRIFIPCRGRLEQPERSMSVMAMLCQQSGLPDEPSRRANRGAHALDTAIAASRAPCPPLLNTREPSQNRAGRRHLRRGEK